VIDVVSVFRGCFLLIENWIVKVVSFYVSAFVLTVAGSLVPIREQVGSFCWK
jgi:hypothetical protein